MELPHVGFSNPFHSCTHLIQRTGKNQNKVIGDISGGAPAYTLADLAWLT